jgi:hypothetical protein
MRISRLAKILAAAVLSICGPRLASAAELTLQWDPPSDGITRGYIVYYGTESGSYLRSVDAGDTTLYTLSGLSGGTTYYVAVRAYDQTGATSDRSNEVSAATKLDVITALALTANVASPQVVGTSVAWRATATGGVAPHQFQWTFDGGNQRTVSPWTTSSTWMWTPSIAGNYEIRVAARSSGSSSAGEMIQSVPFTVTAPRVTVTLFPSIASPQTVGSTIRWSATASGNAAGYQYAWWVFNGSVWSQKTQWTTSSTWSWIPLVPNDRYLVAVWVRSAGSTGRAEAIASVPFPIN